MSCLSLDSNVSGFGCGKVLWVQCEPGYSVNWYLGRFTPQDGSLCTMGNKAVHFPWFLSFTLRQESYVCFGGWSQGFTHPGHLSERKSRSSVCPRHPADISSFHAGLQLELLHPFLLRRLHSATYCAKPSESPSSILTLTGCGDTSPERPPALSHSPPCVCKRWDSY